MKRCYIFLFSLCCVLLLVRINYRSDERAGKTGEDAIRATVVGFLSDYEKRNYYGMKKYCAEIYYQKNIEKDRDGHSPNEIIAARLDKIESVLKKNNGWYYVLTKASFEYEKTSVEYEACKPWIDRMVFFKVRKLLGKYVITDMAYFEDELNDYDLYGYGWSDELSSESYKEEVRKEDDKIEAQNARKVAYQFFDLLEKKNYVEMKHIMVDMFYQAAVLDEKHQGNFLGSEKIKKISMSNMVKVKEGLYRADIDYKELPSEYSALYLGKGKWRHSGSRIELRKIGGDYKVSVISPGLSF